MMKIGKNEKFVKKKLKIVKKNNGNNNGKWKVCKKIEKKMNKK